MKFLSLEQLQWLVVKGDGDSGNRPDTFKLSQDLVWEIIVIVRDDPNAMVMPGGKIVVHTGLLGLMGGDDEVAAVLGHEVAHVLARHTVSLTFC